MNTSNATFTTSIPTIVSPLLGAVSEHGCCWIVALRVVPHFYVFALYKTVPFLGLSVRYAGQHEGVAGFKFHHHAYELIVYPRS